MTTSGSRVADAMQGVGVESGRSVASGMKAGDDPDKGYTDLYKLNQVWYRTPPQLSLVSKRTILQNQAQRYNYTNPVQDVITFIFNSGEYYVNMNTSYLYFEIGYNNPAQYAQLMAYISQGNIMTIFDEIVFMSSSGTEVNREQQKGLHAASTFRYTHDQQYMDTYGQVQGAPLGSYSQIYNGHGPTQDNPGIPGLGVGGATLPTGDAGGRGMRGYGLHNINAQICAVPQTNTLTLGYAGFIVPMDQLLGCFKPYMNCLMPAGLLAGGRLEMRLKQPTEFLQIAGPNTPNATFTGSCTNLLKDLVTYLTVNKIYINFDAFQLSDAVIKRLVEVAATSEGLTLMFDTYDYTPTPAVTTGTVEAQVTQARSRIVRSWCVLRDDAQVNNPYVNSLCSEAATRRICQAVLPGQAVMTGTAGDTSGSQGICNLISTSATSPSAFTVAYNTKYTQLPASSNLDSKNPSGSAWGVPVVGSYQAQLGSLFFPQQPLTTLKEYYTNALYVWCKSQNDNKDNCSVSYEDFLGGTGWNWATNTFTPQQPNIAAGPWVGPYGCAIYGMLAEKSSILQLSGLPIANSRLLRHKFYINTAPISGTTRTINVFTQFTRQLKVFLGGRVVVRE